MKRLGDGGGLRRSLSWRRYRRLRLADAMKMAGVSVTFEVITGAGHGGTHFQTAEAREMVREFLAASMGPKQ